MAAEHSFMASAVPAVPAAPQPLAAQPSSNASPPSATPQSQAASASAGPGHPSFRRQRASRACESECNPHLRNPLTRERRCCRGRWDSWLGGPARASAPRSTIQETTNANHDASQHATPERFDATLPRSAFPAPIAPPLASSAAFPSLSARRHRRPAQRTLKVSEETATTAPQRAPRSSRARDQPYSTPKMAPRPPPSRLPTPPSRPPIMAPMCSL